MVEKMELVAKMVVALTSLEQKSIRWSSLPSVVRLSEMVRIAKLSYEVKLVDKTVKIELLNVILTNHSFA